MFMVLAWNTCSGFHVPMRLVIGPCTTIANEISQLLDAMRRLILILPI